MRVFTMAYGLICYLFFLASFLYAIGFVGNVLVPKTLDSGVAGPPVQALIWNGAILGLFAVQHSVMARPAFKRWWTSIIPKVVERSTYVLVSSLTLAAVFVVWQPLPATVWTVTAPAGVMALNGLFWLGWTIVVLSTFLLGHFEFFGLRQVWLNLRDRPFPDPVFRTPFLYGLVRHPIYLGFLLAFWSTPVMSQGHLFFAVMTTLYMLVGIQLEERDLVTAFGDTYRSYKRRVSMIIPLPGTSKPD
ncbi:methanethiol S-methyltransferase [Maricaulis sp. CAU 1757]